MPTSVFYWKFVGTKASFMVLFVLFCLVVIGLLWFLRHPVFGKPPQGARLERMKQSPNFREGVFHNLSPTPALTEGYSMPGVLYDFLFKKVPFRKPPFIIPSVKTNLHTLPPETNLLIWFGHSSYYLQVNGVKFLVDPVFSGNASPLPGTTRAFPGSNDYQAEDIPDLDYLLITHDHYDHLDYKTVRLLHSKAKKIFTGLGVGSHLEHWGVPSTAITELDWNESAKLEKNMVLHALPARHFSGRSFTRNQTLWLSFLLETPGQKLFLGGDSGYDAHFEMIGKRFGPIDLAILENGQYNLAWQAIHCLPDEVLKAARDLQARSVLPVHSGKFSLAPHSWNEPLQEISRLSSEDPLVLLTPQIGEPVFWQDPQQVYSSWWEENPSR